MYFWFGCELQQLLFSTINISTVAGIIATCACTIGLVLFLEASKVGLSFSKFHSAVLRPNEKRECFTDDMLLLENQTPSKTARYAWLLTEVGFYIVELIMGYVVMLLVMTYNGYLMLSVLLASGIGYFLLGQTLMTFQMKTSKLNSPCGQCSTHQKNSSITSSTEAITESVNDEQERCCLRDSAEIVAETETKY